MNGQMLVEQVRDSKGIELDRLGSDKALLAATSADLSSGTVLGTVALTLDGLRTTFEEWADGTGVGGDAFGEAASATGEEYDRVVAELDTVPSGDPPPAVGTVRSFDRAIERVGAGLLGHGLVFDGTLLQAVSFFVNEADAARADLVRDLRSSANSRVDEGATVLDSLCRDETDWERAEAAAGEVVETAYREYVETLGELGIDPKPVC